MSTTALSPSMTQRRGIALRILVIPPESPAADCSNNAPPCFDMATTTGDEDEQQKAAAAASFRRRGNSRGGDDRNLLSLPLPEFSPSYSTKSTRKFSNVSSGSGGSCFLSLSPSNLTLSSSNNDLLSPSCQWLSPFPSPCLPSRSGSALSWSGSTKNESLSPALSPSLPIPFRNSRSSYTLYSSSSSNVAAASRGGKCDSEAELQNLWPSSGSQQQQNNSFYYAPGRETPSLLSPSPFRCSSPMSKAGYLLHAVDKPRLHHAASLREHHRHRRESNAASLTQWLAVPWESPGGSQFALNRYRGSSLGHSCPQLNFGGSTSGANSSANSSTAVASAALLHSCPSVKLRKELSIQRRHSHRSSRRSYHANTSPILTRCRSPVRLNTNSGDVQRTSPNLVPVCSPVAQFKPKIHGGVDTRRWSLASLPSSGYGTPGSSAMSSQYSSSERLAYFGEEHRPVGPPCHFGSNDSNPSNNAEDVMQTSMQGGLRVRSRSFNNSTKSHGDTVEVALRNNVYKERFPKAKQQMEEKLTKFISDYSLDLTADSVTATSDENLLKILSDGSARFVHHQILELAADVLQKSRDDLISSGYFIDVSHNLEDLLVEAKEKAPDSIDALTHLAQKLMLILSRPARLLECLEFDPDEFYRFLEEAEGEAREVRGITSDLPQYIIQKLCLNREPLENLNVDLSSSIDERPSSRSSTPSMNIPRAQIEPAALSPYEQFTPPKRERASSAVEVIRRQAPKEEDFETIKLVSNGAYGAVYLVRHVETRQKFALKKLKKSNLALRNQIDQVYAERDILQFTDNPFVVSFYGSFETKRHLCMVLEYVEGGDCATLLKHIGVFPVDMARLYIAETVLAIEYLHSYGIVHRDLKPDNLLITAMGHIKLTDFGLSKIGLMNRTNLLYEGCLDLSDTQQFQDRQICGTPEYIAPEVILMNGYGKPVDWWSLGIILYEFLIGVVPFFGDTPEDLFSHVISDEISWPEEPYAPPEEAQDLISSLLQQNQLDRIGTVNGAVEIKSHPFFHELNWNSLLRQKAEFVPQLEGEDDTSYFDTRADRYHHDVESDDEEATASSSVVPAPAVDNESLLFSSFSSCSPRFSLLTEQAKLSDFSSEGSVDSPTVLLSGAVPRRQRTRLSTASTLSDVESGLPTSQSESSDLVTAGGEISRKSSDVASHPISSLAKPNNRKPVEPATTSQPTSGDLVVDGVQIRRRTNTIPLPRLAVSMDETDLEDHSHLIKELSPVDEHTVSDHSRQQQTSTAVISKRQTLTVGPPAATVEEKVEKTPHRQKLGATPSPPGHQQASLSRQLSAPSGPPLVRKLQATTAVPASQGLHLVIPADTSTTAAAMPSIQSPGGSSTSSRDGSPSRGSSGTDLLPLINQLKPPIVIRRGPKGYGFTFRTIRVYLGQSEYYTIQHIVTAVETGSPAFEAGLRPDDLITHANKDSVQNWTHPQVVHCMLSGGDVLALRVSPLDQTSIKQGGPRKSVGKLARRKGYKQKLQRRALEKKNRKTSLFRRLSGKRASAELNSLGYGGHHTAMQRSASTCEGMLPSGGSSASSITVTVGANGSNAAGASVLVRAGSVSSASTPKAVGHHDSSSSSSPASSVPNSPAGPFINALQTRPSTLHGLKHKLAATLRSPTRRKHAQTMPLSPLARSDSAAAAAATSSSSSSNNTPAAATSVKEKEITGSTTVKEIPPKEEAKQAAATAVPTHLSTSPSRSPSPLAAGAVSSSSPSTRARSSSNVKKTITMPKKSTEAAPPSTLLLQTLHPSKAESGEKRDRSGATGGSKAESIDKKDRSGAAARKTSS